MAPRAPCIRMVVTLITLLPLLHPSIGVVPHGCWYKVGYSGIDGEHSGTVTNVTSARDCALVCTHAPTCDGFTFEATTCTMRKNVKSIGVQEANERTNGICPKVKQVRLFSAPEPITPPPAPLRCTDNKTFCNFPFSLNGFLHWDCVRNGSGVEVCPVETNVTHITKKVENLEEFVPCVPCEERCDVSENYAGFALITTLGRGKAIYEGVSILECQTLCKIVKGCNFFLYLVSKKCILKYGTGAKHPNSQNHQYGPKYCSGDCNNNPLTNDSGNCTVNCKEGSELIGREVPVPAEHLGWRCPEEPTTSMTPKPKPIEEEKPQDHSAILFLIWLIICCLGFLSWKFILEKRFRKEKEFEVLVPVEDDNLPDILLPNHVILKKDEHLIENAIEFANNIECLEEEFREVEDYATVSISKTYHVSQQIENKPHNRYRDIVPFDDNHVVLTSELFAAPDTGYVNASRVAFPGYPQAFLAAQAPKEGSFTHFWHMVIQEKVSVLVMITRLQEGTKRKADQYWPDEAAPVLTLGGAARVEHISTDSQGSLIIRRLSLWLPDGGTRKVVQVQTEAWPDLQAPDCTRVLLDLLHLARELQEGAREPGPMLVHCSAGVGRTGTFIALYKLWMDYRNPEVTELALLPTVLFLRQHRLKMVQKEVQYAYIAKCLSVMVSSTVDGEYYEVNLVETEEPLAENKIQSDLN